MRVGIVRIDRRRFFQNDTRLCFRAGLQINRSQITKRGRVIRRIFYCRFKIFNRFCGFALSFIRQTELIFRLEIIRIYFHTMPELAACIFDFFGLRRES